jgi:hypothetical protein
VAAATISSDVLLKKAIVPLMRFESGIGLYRFRYW